jgi:hypothetical protein
LMQVDSDGDGQSDGPRTQGHPGGDLAPSGRDSRYWKRSPTALPNTLW